MPGGQAPHSCASPWKAPVSTIHPFNVYRAPAMCQAPGATKINKILSGINKTVTILKRIKMKNILQLLSLRCLPGSRCSFMEFPQHFSKGWRNEGTWEPKLLGTGGYQDRLFGRDRNAAGGKQKGFLADRQQVQRHRGGKCVCVCVCVCACKRDCVSECV